MPQSITKHGITYNDDYAWLEKMNSPEVTAWVATQNKLTDAQLATTAAKIYPLPTLQKIRMVNLPHLQV